MDEACLAEDARVGGDHDKERDDHSETDDGHRVRVGRTPLDRTDGLVAYVLVARPAEHRRQREERRQQPDP